MRFHAKPPFTRSADKETKKLQEEESEKDEEDEDGDNGNNVNNGDKDRGQWGGETMKEKDNM